MLSPTLPALLKRVIIMKTFNLGRGVWGCASSHTLPFCSRGYYHADILMRGAISHPIRAAPKAIITWIFLISVVSFFLCVWGGGGGGGARWGGCVLSLN